MPESSKIRTFQAQEEHCMKDLQKNEWNKMSINIREYTRAIWAYQNFDFARTSLVAQSFMR